MGLWIRSQDKKTLIKADKIAIYPCDGWLIGKDVFNAYGVYQTKERALEVLDEIQIEISAYIGTMAQIVYEMPKE